MDLYVGFVFCLVILAGFFMAGFVYREWKSEDINTSKDRYLGKFKK